MIIPDSVRNSFYDNPIGGLAMNLVGPLGRGSRSAGSWPWSAR